MQIDTKAAGATPGLPESPYTARGAQTPLVQSIIAAASSYDTAAQKYIFYNRLLGWSAALTAGLLLFQEVTGAGSSITDVMFGNDAGRGLLSMLNMTFVLMLTTMGDLRGTAGRNEDMALRYWELADSAVNKGQSGEAALADAKLSLDREASRSKLTLYDPISLCCSSFCAAGPFIYLMCARRCKCCPQPQSQGEALLGEGFMRSDDLENPPEWLGNAVNKFESSTGIDLDGDGVVQEAAPAPEGAEKKVGWLEKIEAATGLDLDGDGKVAGVAKPPAAANAKSDSESDDDSSSGGAPTDDDDDDDDDDKKSKGKKEVKQDV